MEIPSLKKKTAVGPWKVSKTIGSGGQGSVYEVRRIRGRAPPRALKACFLEGEKERARFLREIELLQECASEHVLAIIEAETEWEERIEGLPPFAYYVSEKCDGSLRDLCNPDQSPSEKLDLFRQAADAVASLHGRENPVLHRDIKPANFLLAPEPKRLVIADFGIAREVENETVLTETHEVVGSRFFRAPETLSGGTATVQSDVYSLGRLLEWMMSGVLPQDVVPTKLAKGHRLSDDACDRLDAVIARAAAVDPRQRFASVKELRAALPALWLDVRPVPTATVDQEGLRNPLTVLDTALELARTGDTVGWRLLERDVRADFGPRALAWREPLEQSRPRNDAMRPHLDRLVEIAMPRITLGLVAVFAGKPELAEPRRLVDDLVAVDGWNRGGLSVLVEAPRFLIFVLSHLYGASCMEFSAAKSALELSEVAIPLQRYAESKPLWKHHDITGWPELLFNKECKKAWAYLEALFSQHEVVRRLFASERDFRVALGCHNLLRSIAELAADAGALEKAEEPERNFFQEIPPMYSLQPSEDRKAVLRRVSADAEMVRTVARHRNIEVERLRALWPVWSAITQRFATNVSNHGIWPDQLPLGDLA